MVLSKPKFYADSVSTLIINLFQCEVADRASFLSCGRITSSYSQKWSVDSVNKNTSAENFGIVSCICDKARPS